MWLVLLFAAGPPTPAFTPLATLTADCGAGALAFSPDGKRLAAGAAQSPVGEGGRVLLFDPATGKADAPLDALENPVAGLAFRPDGKELAAVASDGEWAVWDVGRAAVVRSGGKGLRRADSDPLAVDLSADGRRLLVCLSGAATTWDTMAVRSTTRGRARGDGRVTALLPGGAALAVGNYQDLDLYDPATGRRTASLLDHPGRVSGVAFAPDARAVVTGTRYDTDDDTLDSALFLWDVPARRVRRTLRLGDVAVARLATTADGRRLAAVVSIPNGIHAITEVRVYDLPALAEAGRLRLTGIWYQLHLAFRPDGGVLAIGGEGKVHLFELLPPGR